MDVFDPLLHVALRSLVVMFPLTVGWLAFRRLALSKTANAWIYAAVCLFSAITAAGVLPWTLGLTSINWIMVALALLSPAVWIGIVLLCDVSRFHRYGSDPLAGAARNVAVRSAPVLAPLVLKTRIEHDSGAPVFRHRNMTVEPEPPTREVGTAARTILRLARDIRGNSSSDRRRPKLLPPPDDTELPFLRNSSDA